MFVRVEFGKKYHGQDSHHALVGTGVHENENGRETNQARYKPIHATMTALGYCLVNHKVYVASVGQRAKQTERDTEKKQNKRRMITFETPDGVLCYTVASLFSLAVEI